jgi:hypothetical protein
MVRYTAGCVGQLGLVWLTLPGSILVRAVSESGQAASFSSGQSSEKGTKTVLLRSTAVPSGGLFVGRNQKTIENRSGASRPFGVHHSNIQGLGSVPA